MLGEKIRKLRKENNLTQDDLAYKLNVTRQAVSKWENDLSYPDTKNIVDLAKIFDCSTDYLLNNSSNEVIVKENKSNVFLRNINILTFISILLSFSYFIIKKVELFKDDYSIIMWIIAYGLIGLLWVLINIRNIKVDYKNIIPDLLTGLIIFIPIAVSEVYTPIANTHLLATLSMYSISLFLIIGFKSFLNKRINLNQILKMTSLLLIFITINIDEMPSFKLFIVLSSIIIFIISLVFDILKDKKEFKKLNKFDFIYLAVILISGVIIYLFGGGKHFYVYSLIILVINLFLIILFNKKMKITLNVIYIILLLKLLIIVISTKTFIIGYFAVIASILLASMISINLIFKNDKII